jgi:uncharacterized SAM-binding protein YcdF (DUF218 family)
MYLSKHKVVRDLFLVALGLSGACVLASVAGRLLVIDEPLHADLIVVLDGDFGDVRLKQGLYLLRSGFAQQLVLDAPNRLQYGSSLSDAATNYLRTAAPDQAGRVHVCTLSRDSTWQELADVSNCIHRVAPHAASAIVLTSNFHTRRALLIARRILPEYSWSVASAPDSRFDVHWWRDREWAKTTLTEWQRLLWWTIVEQWFVHQSSRPSSH